MKTTPLALALIAQAEALNIFKSKEAASQHLTGRAKRDNGGIFEEIMAADLTRECEDEVCSFDEVLEAMDNNSEKAKKWWSEATEMCQKENTCHPEGTQVCINKWQNRECVCRKGWTSDGEFDDCSLDIDECLNENFCENGGLCVNKIGSFDCQCTKFWEGTNCELDINECEADIDVCQNNGVCTNKEEGYTCSCPPEWTGENCEIDVNECEVDNPCQNNSGCINLAGGYQCLCNNGWGGANCDEDFDECGANLCPEGTICQIVDGSMNQFTCVCPERGCNNLDEAEYLQLSEAIYDPEEPEYEQPAEESSDDSVSYEGDMDMDEGLEDDMSTDDMSSDDNVSDYGEESDSSEGALDEMPEADEDIVVEYNNTYDDQEDQGTELTVDDNDSFDNYDSFEAPADDTVAEEDVSDDTGSIYGSESADQQEYGNTYTQTDDYMNYQ